MTKQKNTYRQLTLWLIVSEFLLWSLTGLGMLFLHFSELSFLHPEAFYVWLVIPVVSCFSWRHWRARNQIIQQFEGFGRTAMLQVSFDFRSSFLRYIFFRFLLFWLVLAMAQPVAGSHRAVGSKRILDLVICLDVSNSMNTKDMGENGVSRLTAAKNAIGEILNQTRGERVSIVLFANDAFTQLPLTMDYGAAKLFVPDIQTDMISNQGTNIGRALEEAQRQFVDSEAGRAILVVTDGEDHEALWKEQLAKIVDKRISLSYLGLGSQRGGPIPNDPNDFSLGFKRENGQPIISRLNVDALKAMAQTSKSQLVISDSEFPLVVDLVAQFKNAKNKRERKVEFLVNTNYFFIPTWLAIFSLLLFFVVGIFSKTDLK